jgi:hypothetical protein
VDSPPLSPFESAVLQELGAIRRLLQLFVEAAADEAEADEVPERDLDGTLSGAGQRVAGVSLDGGL